MDELLEAIIGKYYYKDLDEESGFGNEYYLELTKGEKDNLVFKLEMTTVGEFGKVGETWLGRGVSRGDHIALIIEKKINWVEDHKKEKVEDPEEIVKSLPIELYPHFDQVVIYHKSLNRYVILDRIED